MSWFDTTGLANLAKNALKEAQKQIDKALDIKDEEESYDIGAASVSVEKSNDENIKNSLPEYLVSIHNTTEANNALQLKPFGITTEADNGTLNDQSLQSPSNGIELSPDSRSWNIRVGDAIKPLTSRMTEADCSEWKEVLTSDSQTGSTITVFSQQSSWAITSHNHEASASLKLIDMFSTSRVSTPTVCVDHGSSQRSPKGQGQPSNLLSKQPQDEGRDKIVGNNLLPYALSEQPNGALETCVNSSPITVAPCRSSNPFSVPIAQVTHVFDVALPTTKQLNETCNESHLVLEPFSNDTYKSCYSSENVLKESAKKYPTLSLEAQILPKKELENSFENLEMQADISDLAQSFEEVKCVSNVIGSDFTTASSRQLENSENNSDASFESPVGLVTSQHLFQSLGEDEIETTTSSDIEIISSPNGGDSSSTNSGFYRSSPLKMSMAKGECFDMLLSRKRRGHAREHSDASINSGNSDDSGHLPETQRLMQRLVEVSKTLEQREYRLVELGRQNAELNEQNAQLNAQLENKAKREGSTDLDGYMQRLSALERRFQQSIREKESLKCKLDALRIEADKKVSKSDMDKALVERDFMINELQKEGENLSKQVLHHSNIIKKLRTKEKECDVLIRKQCDEINELTLETERLKRTLSAKDEVERSQIDAVHKLTSEKCKLEQERAMFSGNLDDQLKKYETLRKSFELAHNELHEKTYLCQDLQTRLAKLQNSEHDFLSFQKTNNMLVEQLDDLREQLRKTEQDYGQRLNRDKLEHVEVLRKLEAAELRNEEEKKAAALLTMPLIRQLESLQNILRRKERVSEQRDVSFAQKLSEALERIMLIAEKEKTQRDMIVSMQNRVTTLEERLVSAHRQIEASVNKLKQQTHNGELVKQDHYVQLTKKESDCMAKLIFSDNEEHKHLTQSDCVNDITVLSRHIATHVATVSGIEDSTNTDSLMPELDFDFHPVEASPVASFGNLSFPDSLNTIPWTSPEDDIVSEGKGKVEEVVNVGYNVSILFNTTSQLETLQATLKQRDGEVNQLQWEVSRFQNERTMLSAEISNLTMELENIRERSERSVRLEEEHHELQNRYDALLQMYGESVEKTEELQLDLEDVKEMFKIQIDDLLQRQRDLIASIKQNSAVR